MSDFQWDPESNQTYDSSFGNTYLKGAGAQFSKESGTEFAMEAPECELTLDVTDDADIKWPLRLGGTNILRMFFTEGIFKINTRGNIFLGLLNDGKYNYSQNILLKASQSTISFISQEGTITIGGREASRLEATDNASILLQAIDINFLAGNIICDEDAKITCSALAITAEKSLNDLNAITPVFNLMTYTNHTAQIEFKNIINDNNENPWHFAGSAGSHPQGTCNFITNGKTANNNGKFIFRGMNGFARQYLQTSGFMAIDGTPVIGEDEFNKRFSINEIFTDNQQNWTIEISVK